MNVFVTGTGRCGTVTFSRACRHITNFSSTHERQSGRADPSRWRYPDHHIEVDPHIAWTFGPILQRYPDALYVHLQRRREDVVASWFRRGIQPHSGPAPLLDVICQTRCGDLSRTAYIEALGLLYDTVTQNIESALSQVNSQHIWLHDAATAFPEFWKKIGAIGDLDAAVSEFHHRYNAS